MARELTSGGTLSNVLHSTGAALSEKLPNLAAAIALLLIGVGAAKLAELLLRRLCGRLGLDQALGRMGVSAVLERVGWTRPPCRLLERVAFFLVLFLFVEQAVAVAGLSTVSGFLAAVLGFAPRLIAALGILVTGSLVAAVAGRVTAGGARGVGVEFSSLLGRLVAGLTMAVAVLMAFAHLQIDSFLPQGLILGAFLGLVSALAITFGLGSKELSRNILAGAYARRIYEPGTFIEVDGERGVLIAITPLQTLIQQDDEVVAVPNTVFLKKKIRS
ncbi:MAG TPA: mechanosensitive ion channel [Candidatus Krumholzibacteria bacterium]|nr:mechanosensitive ion channel [Candidatus Krumholzibacteria bacterium]